MTHQVLRSGQRVVVHCTLLLIATLLVGAPASAAAPAGDAAPPESTINARLFDIPDPPEGGRGGQVYLSH